ncbi:MAG: hypothetical protein RL398_396 [Planctomycetota bacterium]
MTESGATARVATLRGKLLELSLLCVAMWAVGTLMYWRGLAVKDAIVWLPTGVAVAGLWRVGPIGLVAVAFAIFTTREAMGYSVLESALAALASSVEALGAWWLLRRLGFRADFGRMRDIFALFTVAAAIPFLSAGVTYASRMAVHDVPLHEAVIGWASWWRMNALGVLALVPLALGLRRPTWLERSPGYWWQLAALLVAALVTVWPTLLVLKPSVTGVVILYAALLLPLLGALRLGPPGAIVPSTAAAFFVLLATSSNRGPFLTAPADERFAPLQIFLLTVLCAPLVFGGLVAEREVGLARQRQLEDQLRHAQKLDAIGKLAGGIAHDSNNLLTAIYGYAESLLRSLPEGDARRADAEGVLQAAKRSSALIRQLLAFARRQPMQLSVIDLREVIGSLLPILRRLLGSSIELTTPTGLHRCPVEVDRVQMEQVLVNLAVNGRDAMPGGGKLEIACGITGDEREVLLSVRDWGHGMREEVRLRAFEPFFTTKDPAKGTGLGLATVYGIVRQFGGTIQLDSAPGMGTTVRIRLPRADAAPSTPMPESRTEPSPIVGQRGLILVVEDEPMLRALAIKELRRMGFEVLAAADGREAVALATAHMAQLRMVVTDVVMPGLQGREWVNLAFGDRQDLPVIYMSGYADDVESWQLRPHETFLAKPFGASELTAAVRRRLEEEQRKPA